MTVSSGFFDSKNHDRVYNAEQMSSIFDGVITDGIFQGVGDAFAVTAVPGVDNAVLVGRGRAWFDHTWTLNDAPLTLTIDPPSSAMGRWDAIVLDIDRTEEVRKNSIMVIKGIYNLDPQRPVLIKEPYHKQYPLAYIEVPRGTPGPLDAARIYNMIGTDECPLVTGILETLDIDMFVNQMEAKFENWFDGIESVLEGDVALNLQTQINQLKEKVDNSVESAIDFETLEKARNTKFRVYDLSSTSAEGSASAIMFTTVTPSGGAVSLVSINDQYKILIHDRNGVLVSNTVIPDFGVPQDNLYVNIVDATCTTSTVVRFMQFKETSSSDLMYVNGDEGTLCSYNVSTTNVLTYSKTSKAHTYSTPMGAKFETSDAQIRGGFTSKRPYILDNGDKVVPHSVYVFNGGYPDYNYRHSRLNLYTIDSNGLLGDVHEVALPNERYGMFNEPIMYSTKSTSKNDYIAISQTSPTTGSNTSYTVLINKNDLTYANAQDTVYENNVNNLTGFFSDGLIVRSSTSIGVYDGAFGPSSSIAIPMSMDVSWSLDDSEGFGGWIAGTMTEDRKFLIVGNANKIRTGIIPENGLMIWSPASSSTAMSSSTTTMSQLALPNSASWWHNSNATKVSYVIGWTITTTQRSEVKYMEAINFKFLGKPLLITIDTEA